MSLFIGKMHRLILSAGLALFLVLSTAWPAGVASQTASVYELAFVRDGDIFKIRSDGTGLTQLTTGGGNSEPAWSPDGSRIAFVHQGGSSVASQIYVMSADGSNLAPRTNAGAFNTSPAWSPDGTRIAFSSVRDGQFRIYVMHVDEDWWNPAPVGFDRGWNAQPAWSPDGTRIAFVSDWRAFDIVYDLYVMNADGSDVQLLLGGTLYFQPAWSPDGGAIAVTACSYARDNCFPNSGVAVVNPDGSAPRSIATAGGFARPTWSPDGAVIAFGSSVCRECASTIRYVTRDGHGSGVLVQDAHSPSWRPSSSAVAPRRAVEYVNDVTHHYVLLSDPSEIAGVDAGAAGPSWHRTGYAFSVSDAGSDLRDGTVCRFYAPGANTHFFTASAAECSALRANGHGWVFEKLAFSAIAANGGCAAPLSPVFRLYNNRWMYNDSNHRYTPDATVRAQFVAAGWIDEGIAFCVAWWENGG